jgi:hypothetical protein
MKSFFVFLLTAFTIVSSCRKAKDLKTMIRGTWELTATYGGFGISRTYEPGQGNRAIISAGHISTYRQNQLMVDGDYKYADHDTYDYYHQFTGTEHLLIIDDQVSHSTITLHADFNNGRLVLFTNFPDMPKEEYTRASN